MPDQLDPTKFHVLDTKKKKILLIVLSFLVLISIPFFVFYYNFAVNRPAQNSESTTIEILSGWGVSDISAELYTKDLINSQGLFLSYVTLYNLAKNIQAGVYTIPAGTSLKDLVPLLQKGTKDVKITFLEGWRVEQFALEASKYLKFVNYEDFVLQASSLEGYLFPDTYFVRYDISTEDLIDLLSDTFEEKTKDLFDQKSGLSAELSDEDIAIIASLVEREIHVEEDRPVIAGIIITRLLNKIPLGVDSTTQYYAPFLQAKCPNRSWVKCFTGEEAENIDWWSDSISQADLTYDSPYNTRRNLGLPPTPISSFGLSALKAAINPVESDYLYYLSDKSGITRFATTLAGHEANILNFLR
jgi:UPF0755 protein